MGREYPLRPIVGVGAVILRGEEVLLARRNRPPSLGVWSIPGGALELGESLEDACRREVLEETGLSIEIIDRCAVLERVRRDAWERVQYHYVLIDFVCRPTGGQLSAASDISEARWYPLRTLPQVEPMTEATAEVILKAVEDLRGRNIPF